MLKKIMDKINKIGYKEEGPYYNEMDYSGRRMDSSGSFIPPQNVPPQMTCAPSAARMNKSVGPHNQLPQQNEKVTSLIMEQIKELIDIDANFNMKLNEVEAKLDTNAGFMDRMQKCFDHQQEKIQMLERCLEKVMGLFEALSGQVNLPNTRNHSHHERHHNNQNFNQQMDTNQFHSSQSHNPHRGQSDGRLMNGFMQLADKFENNKRKRH